MSDYPDSDYPWTFYFNGTAMPKWSQCWAACGVLNTARAAMHDRGERITYQDLWLLCCRIDHIGVVESEDPLRFQVLALQVLYLLLTEEPVVLKSLAPLASELNTSPEAIYAGVRDGLFQLIDAAARDKMAFWTTGYEADRAALTEVIRRHRLPAGHPEYVEAPHLRRDRREAELRWEFLRKDMIALIRTSTLPKSLRTAIHELPKPA